MKNFNILNNLNQLLSHVKTTFGRKATTATAALPKAEPPTDLSVVSDHRLKAALADIEKYLGDNYGTPTAKLHYRDYTNGASLDSEDTTFSVSLVILTEAEGAAHLPDNVILLGTVSSSKDDDWLVEELGKLIVFLKKTWSNPPNPVSRHRLLQRQARPPGHRQRSRRHLHPPLLIHFLYFRRQEQLLVGENFFQNQTLRCLCLQISNLTNSFLLLNIAAYFNLLSSLLAT